MGTKPKTTKPYNHWTKGDYPKSRHWNDVVDWELAKSQIAWEINQMIFRMREVTGMTYDEIGKRFNISGGQARIRYLRAERQRKRSSPVEQHLSRLPHDLKPAVFEINVRIGEKNDSPKIDHPSRDNGRNRDPFRFDLCPDA